VAYNVHRVYLKFNTKTKFWGEILDNVGIMRNRVARESNWGECRSEAFSL